MFKLLATVLLSGQLIAHFHGATNFPTLAACNGYLDINRTELTENLVTYYGDDWPEGYKIEIVCNDGAEPEGVVRKTPAGFQRGGDPWGDIAGIFRDMTRQGGFGHLDNTPR